MVNFEQNKRNLKISYVNKESTISFLDIEIEPQDLFEWEITDKNTKTKSYDGVNVCKKQRARLSRTRLLSIIHSLDNKTKEKIFQPLQPKKYFINVKTKIIEGFPDINTTMEPIQSITIINSTNKVFFLCLKELTKEATDVIKKDINKHFSTDVYDVSIISFDTEYDLLYSFFGNLLQKMPLVTGWGLMEFDWKYLMNRAKMLNIDISLASPTGIVNNYRPLHRFVVDYKDVFDTFDTSVHIKESTKLAWVANKVLGISKIKTRQTLQGMYDKDFLKYVAYNAVEVILNKLIEEKLNLFNIVFLHSHFAFVEPDKVFSELSKIESLTIKYMLQENLPILHKQTKQKTTYKGSFVMEPKSGLLKYITVFDCRSMFPTLMMQWNMSPDVKCTDDDCNKTVTGTAFSKDRRGIMTQILDDFFDKRQATVRTVQKIKSDKEKLLKYISSNVNME